MRKVFIIILVLLLSGITASAQSIRDLRINEVLVKNIDNYEDDYGHRSSWVELYNTGHAVLNLSGCYLEVVNRDGSTVRYRIPANDPRTVVAPLGYSIFFCEGTDTKGTFYTNFTLDDAVSVALINASGKGEPIDILSWGVEAQLPDVSIGRYTTEDGDVLVKQLPKTTPYATNNTDEVIPQHEKFRRMDPYGVVMSITAMSVVLMALLVLFILFKLVGNYMVSIARRKEAASKKLAGMEENSAKAVPYSSPHSGEEIAAIAMALRLYQKDLHDTESAVLTINRVARAYSPWSSKIYGLRKIPRN